MLAFGPSALAPSVSSPTAPTPCQLHYLLARVSWKSLAGKKKPARRGSSKLQAGKKRELQAGKQRELQAGKKRGLQEGKKEFLQVNGNKHGKEVRRELLRDQGAGGFACCCAAGAKTNMALACTPLVLCSALGAALGLPAGASLEQALLEDMLPASSSRCSDGSSSQFTSTFTFPGTDPRSEWDAPFQPLEGEVFLAQMEHMDKNANRTWRMRIGHGGNPYSFMGKFGEAMPPQKHAHAPWIDEVWQMVAVDNTKNKAESPFFIHQAGSYQRESILKRKPFYSPNVASHCSREQRFCAFVSWGQQAHVPTEFTSSMLYYTRYQVSRSLCLSKATGVGLNCGDRTVVTALSRSPGWGTTWVLLGAPRGTNGTI